ncbi:hypothetical protein EBQ74_05440 [bacterium]|nr:hypothetical protein [bacterium]
MNRYLIVGGGITGIIMGRILSDKGLTFQGLEKVTENRKRFYLRAASYPPRQSLGIDKKYERCGRMDKNR